MNLTLGQSAQQLQSFVLHQSMTLLNLTGAELAEVLLDAAEDNPHLRVRPPKRRFLLRGGSAEVLEQTLATQDGLFAHVATELAALLAAGGKLGQVVTCLMEELDPCGWILTDLGEIAGRLQIDEDLIEATLTLVQKRVSPTGLFARTLTECLRLQLEEQGALNAEMAAVLNNLAVLETGGLAAMVEATGLAEDTVRACLTRLQSLDPKPGARFRGDPALTREPDARVTWQAGRWQLRFNRDAEPSVEIASMPAASGNAELAQALKQARVLKHALELRRSATRQVVSALITRQAGYLVQGEDGLRALSMTELGQATGFHTSTVSRVLKGYLIETPHGIVEAKTLCPGAASRGSGAHSKTQVLRRMRAMIAHEDPAKPLSDARLTALLAQEGIAISRRVAANYRQECGFPRAALRRQPL